MLAPRLILLHRPPHVLRARSLRESGVVFANPASRRLARNGAVASLMPQAMTMFLAIFGRFGRPVSRADLADALWFALPDGGPLDARNCINVTLHHLRAGIAPLGLAIDKDGLGCRATVLHDVPLARAA